MPASNTAVCNRRARQGEPFCVSHALVPVQGREILPREPRAQGAVAAFPPGPRPQLARGHRGLPSPEAQRAAQRGVRHHFSRLPASADPYRRTLPGNHRRGGRVPAGRRAEGSGQQRRGCGACITTIPSKISEPSDADRGITLKLGRALALIDVRAARSPGRHRRHLRVDGRARVHLIRCIALRPRSPPPVPRPRGSGPGAVRGEP